MLISQKEDYFENCLYRLLDEPLLFPLALKRNLYKKGFSSDKTKKKLIFLKTNLASLKTEVDKLDIDKLAPVPVDLSKLIDVVQNDVAKEAVWGRP